MPRYRPRLPEIVAMLDAMPANVDTLTEVSGRPAAWAQRMLSRMVCDRIIQQRHGVYSRVAEIEPSSTLQILSAMQTGPMTRKDVAALGVNPKSAVGILADLERRGRIEVDPVARPLRYSLVRSLERMAEYEDARQGLYGA